MFCRKCGSAIPDESMFCGECGTKVGESGTPQVTYIVKEAKPKPILTSGENVLVKVIGIYKIISYSILLIIFLIGGTMWGFSEQYTAQVMSAVRSIWLLFLLGIAAFIFFGVMVLCKKRWAFIIFDIEQIWGIVISFISVISGSISSVFGLIINIMMAVLLHKCIKALSWKVQEERRTAQPGIQ